MMSGRDAGCGMEREAGESCHAIIVTREFDNRSSDGALIETDTRLTAFRNGFHASAQNILL